MILLWALLACRQTVGPSVAAPSGEQAVSDWAGLLPAVVTPRGDVDYDRLNDERAALDGYVAFLATVRPSSDRDNPQHAFWLNAYNALTLWHVLELGRPASVYEVDGLLPVPGSGFFFERAVPVQGLATSLWEIAHERLRGRQMDVRDHAAMYGATRGGAPLAPVFFRPANLEQQLDAVMAAWLAHPTRGVQIDPDGVALPPAFGNFAGDFDRWTGGVDPCTTALRALRAVGEDGEGGADDRPRALAQAARTGCVARVVTEDLRLDDAGVGDDDEGGGSAPR
ncbi:MAG: hypothetical protein RLZZ383_1643 [Pseudomonadota bacterium]